MKHHMCLRRQLLHLHFSSMCSLNTALELILSFVWSNLLPHDHIFSHFCSKIWSFSYSVYRTCLAYYVSLVAPKSAMQCQKYQSNHCFHLNKNVCFASRTAEVNSLLSHITIKQHPALREYVYGAQNFMLWGFKLWSQSFRKPVR